MARVDSFLPLDAQATSSAEHFLKRRFRLALEMPRKTAQADGFSEWARLLISMGPAAAIERATVQYLP